MYALENLFSLMIKNALDCVAKARSFEALQNPKMGL